jgi:hypothetical protein
VTEYPGAGDSAGGVSELRLELVTVTRTRNLNLKTVKLSGLILLYGTVPVPGPRTPYYMTTVTDPPGGAPARAGPGPPCRAARPPRRRGRRRGRRLYGCGPQGTRPGRGGAGETMKLLCAMAVALRPSH